MGLTNATETFQKMMNTVLKGLTGKICEVYLDDIIIYSETFGDQQRKFRKTKAKPYKITVKVQM
jgi:hypothetical protein